MIKISVIKFCSIVVLTALPACAGYIQARNDESCRDFVIDPSKLLPESRPQHVAPRHRRTSARAAPVRSLRSEGPVALPPSVST